MPGYIMDLRKLVGHRTLMQCAASIIIVNEKNQILLGKRTDNHKWGYAGGSIELDEKVENCARRELFEETGLIADEIEFFMVNSGPEVHYVYPNGDEVSNIEIIYVCRKYHGELKRQEEEIEELKFFNIAEVELDNISPPDKTSGETVYRTEFLANAVQMKCIFSEFNKPFITHFSKFLGKC